MSFVPSPIRPRTQLNFRMAPQTKNGSPSHLTHLSKNQNMFFNFFLKIPKSIFTIDISSFPIIIDPIVWFLGGAESALPLPPNFSSQFWSLPWEGLSVSLSEVDGP